VSEHEDETPDTEPDQGDLEAGADFVGDYPDPRPAETDTASEGT
jgi:hypothetical protein